MNKNHFNICNICRAMLRMVGVGIKILRFCPIFRKTKICYKMAKKHFFVLKFWKFFYIHNFEILALADFHNFTISRFYFYFLFFGIFRFWGKRGKNDPARKFFFRKKLRLEKLGFYMGVKNSIDKERRKP